MQKQPSTILYQNSKNNIFLIQFKKALRNEVPFFVFELAFCKAYVYVFSMDYRFILVGLCFAGSLFSAQFPSAEDFKNPPNNCRFLPIKHGSTVAKPKEAKFQKFSVAESWCNYVNDFGFGGIVTNADWLGENEKGDVFKIEADNNHSRFVLHKTDWNIVSVRLVPKETYGDKNFRIFGFEVS